MRVLLENEEPEGNNIYEWRDVAFVKVADGQVVITFEDAKPTTIFRVEYVRQLLVQ